MNLLKNSSTFAPDKPDKSLRINLSNVSTICFIFHSRANRLDKILKEILTLSFPKQ